MPNSSQYRFNEDIDYLKGWLEQAKDMAHDIRTKAKRDGKISIFTISSTGKVRNNRNPYLTPIRKIMHGFIGGSIVFSQTQAIILSKYVDGIVDKILIDAEKKIGITLGSSEEVLKKFGLVVKMGKNISRMPVEMGNLSAACAKYINKSQYHEYKPNDITVEAVWQFLSNKFKILSGRKIAIIGSGNIGFKLALKLVECGCNVELVRRDLSRGTRMANVINIVKPKATVAIVNYNSNPLQASLFCDALIGCTDGKPVITKEMIQSIKQNGIVIDIGKGTIFNNAVKYSIKNNISVFRCDISSAIDGAISTIQRNIEIIDKEMGRKELENNCFIVSGGQLGQNGDIVVDNYNFPQQIFGIADGVGDIKESLSEEEIERLKKTRELLNI